MAITYNAVELRGKAVEGIFLELFYNNDTLDKGLVTFHDEVKYDTIFSDASATVTQQAWVAGTPTPSGGITLNDTQIVPLKVEYHDTFIPDNLRSGRYKSTMKPGALNDVSDEFTREVLDKLIVGKVSADAESKFWNAAKSATQVSVAALTPGAGQASVGVEEQAYVASLTPSVFDGVVTRLIYNNAALGGRYKIAGTTISVSNIATEYATLTSPVDPKLLQSGEMPIIYAPKSHMLKIMGFNLNPTNFKDVFTKSGNDWYYGIFKIVFVPLPENCMIVARPSDIHWLTDLTSDINLMLVDKLSNFSKTWGYDIVFTQFAHITNQDKIVLYLG